MARKPNARVYLTERAPDRWQLRAYLGVRSDGRPRFKHETHHGDERSALARAREIEAAMLRGEIAGSDAGGDTLGGFLRRYVERLDAAGDLAPSTVKGYREALARVPERLRDRDLTRLAPRDFETLYLDLLERLSPTTVGNTHRFLHLALAYAEKIGEIDRNPCHGVRPPRGRARARSTISDDLDEIDGEARTIPRGVVLDLIKSFDEPTGLRRRNPSLAAMLFTAYATGMRRGELCALSWRAVSLEAGTLAVRRSLYWPYGASESVLKAPKTSAGRRTVTLSPATCARLARWREEIEAISASAGVKVPSVVFPDMRTLAPMRPDMVSSAFRSRMVALGHPGAVNMHALRHTHASELLAAREPVHVVSRRLGHADVATTLRIYAHAIPGSDESVAARIDDVLGLGEVSDPRDLCIVSDD